MGARPFDQEFHVLLDELLEALVVGEGGLEFGHLLGWHIAGDIPAVFVALMIVVRAGGTLADDADGSSVQGLNLRQFLEDRFGSDRSFHVGQRYV